MIKLKSLLTTLFVSSLVAGCGGGSSSPEPPPPPPPPVDLSAAGAWSGTVATPDVPNGSTGFEFDDADGFVIGATPFSADFQGGVAETRGNAALYNDGIYSWHVGAAAAGTVTFETPSASVSFFTRVVTLGDVATISFFDPDGFALEDDLGLPIIFVATDAFTEINVQRDAGELLIGSIVVDVALGEVVIDTFDYGFPSSAAVNDIGCIVSSSNEFACAISDSTTGDYVAGANGDVSVSVNQVTGSGFLYAAPGEVFADGSTIAAITISAGVVNEATTLNLTFDGTGVAIQVSTQFESTFTRGSDLAFVTASYMTFDIFGDASTFDVDAAGAVSGVSADGCTLMGQISVIDATQNAYSVDLGVTDGGGGTCGIPDGDYTGLGATQDDAVTDDTFVFGVAIEGTANLVGNAVK